MIRPVPTTDIKARTNALVNALVPNSPGRAERLDGGRQRRLPPAGRSSFTAPTRAWWCSSPSTRSGRDEGNRSSPTAFSARDCRTARRWPSSASPPPFSASVPARVGEGGLPVRRGRQLLDGEARRTRWRIAAEPRWPALNTSTLDWRMSMVTSSYHVADLEQLGQAARFTRNVNKVKAWLTQGQRVHQRRAAPACPARPMPPPARWHRRGRQRRLLGQRRRQRKRGCARRGPQGHG